MNLLKAQVPAKVDFSLFWKEPQLGPNPLDKYPETLNIEIEGLIGLWHATLHHIMPLVLFIKIIFFLPKSKTRTLCYWGKNQIFHMNFLVAVGRQVGVRRGDLLTITKYFRYFF